jgi:hypothetical protein
MGVWGKLWIFIDSLERYFMYFRTMFEEPLQRYYHNKRMKCPVKKIMVVTNGFLTALRKSALFIWMEIENCFQAISLKFESKIPFWNVTKVFTICKNVRKSLIPNVMLFYIQSILVFSVMQRVKLFQSMAKSVQLYWLEVINWLSCIQGNLTNIAPPPPPPKNRAQW